ncbi:MAG: hypothetical protein GTO14_18725 [Anaerolineales bacterium]|nr:hypothetical protein [Anaerolineales bacterium]
MKFTEVDELSQRLAACLQEFDPKQAFNLVHPLLETRTPFRTLDRLGTKIGTPSLKTLNPFLDLLAQSHTEGGWVLIGSTLASQIQTDLRSAMHRCRSFIIMADVWYATGILGERVPGAALVARFDETLERLRPWREDSNRWVRRALGHATHVWAKRSKGQITTYQNAEALLVFLEPLFEEHDTDALKGIGWGLKTMGKYYPDKVAVWLQKMLVQEKRTPRNLMLKKACAHLPEQVRLRLDEKRLT